MKKLILAICFIFIQNPVISSEISEFSNALGWEKKWNKIITRSTEKYLSRLETGPFAKLSNNDKELAVSEMRDSLKEKLSWEVMGQDFSKGIIQHCDPQTLKTMANYYNGESITKIERKQVAKEYSSCAKKGFSKSMIKLKEVIVNSLPEVKKVMKKYE